MAGNFCDPMLTHANGARYSPVVSIDVINVYKRFFNKKINNAF